MEPKVFEQFCFDFYGELLSERQKLILDYYYNEDCSVSEIGELIGLTRQGVSDAVRRAKKQMQSYEEKLGLVNRYLKTRQLLENVNQKVGDLLSDEQIYQGSALQAEIMQLKQSIDQIIEGI